MKLHELRDWLNQLPEDMADFTVVNGEVGMLEGKYMYQVDKPLTMITVDKDNKEVILMNETKDTEDVIRENL